MNFVEAMALYRAFSVGLFKCSGASPKIMPAEYLSDGYNIKIEKNLPKKLCYDCIGYFFGNKGLRVTQDEKYLTIQSPSRIL
jgi:hypothetical protein